MNDEIKLPELEKYIIHTGDIRAELDSFDGKCLQISQYLSPEHMNTIVNFSYAIEKSEQGEWIKAIDAQAIFDLGFKAGCKKTMQSIAENIFKEVK